MKALDRLRRLAEDRASGELISVSDAAEVHVFLQHGRIAWATSSLHPLEFTRFLLETAEIETGTFREILESCRREKRPLGETLIAWGVATKEEVRAALHHQIESALSAIDDGASTELLFLKRSAQYADYDVTLTFDVADLVVPAPAAALRPSMLVVPATAPPPSEASVRVRMALDGVRWTEEVGAGCSSERIPRDLLDNSLLDGARLVTLQSSGETLAGTLLPQGRALFCLVDSSVTIGEIVSLLGSLSAIHDASSMSPAPLHGSPWTVGRPYDDRMAPVLDEFLERASDVRAVFLAPADQGNGVFGVGRGAVSGDELAQLVLRRGRAFAAPVVPRDSEPPSAADVEGTTSFRAMTLETNCMLFATEIVAAGATHLVWIVLDESVSKGIAWSYLTSLGRTLARVLRPPHT